MIVFDFFDKEKIIVALSELYDINIELIRKINETFFETDNYTYDFIKTFSVDVVNTSVKDVLLRCKHITTTIDDFYSLKEYGMLPLKKLLSIKDSSLYSFYKSHGIVFNVSEHYFTYYDTKVYLINPAEDCKKCFYDGKCKYKTNIFGEPYSNDSLNEICDYRTSIINLATTLYYDNGEIEVHLRGKNICNYSCVNKYPECIMITNKVISDLFNDRTSLVNDWRKATNNQFYCLSFDQSIFNFHTITEKPYFEKEWYYELMDLCDASVTCIDDLNENCFANFYLIQHSIEVLLNDCCELYGQLKQDVTIPFDNIEIESYDNDIHTTG